MAENKPIYDLAIIGGGIAGAGIARDAVLRGISTVLFEKNTYASGTSSKSSRLIHGGIRYLEIAWNHLKKGQIKAFWKNFRFVFNALRESSRLHRMAPDLIRPISLSIPIYRQKDQSLFMIYAGTLLYSVMALVTGSFRFPSIHASTKRILDKVPGLNETALLGGVTIWDHQTNDGQLVLKTIESARQQGLRSFEHSQVVKYEFSPKEELYRITVLLNDNEEVFLARKLVNATGAWVDKVRRENGENGTDFIVPVAGCHLEIKQFMEPSVILQAEDGRIFFVLNQSGLARIGTTERIEHNPDDVKTTHEEVDYLLKELNRYFPRQTFTENDIVSRDAGIRPLAKPESETDAHSISREHEIRTGPTGVLHILGVKLTDHRRAAEEITDVLARDLIKFNPAISLRSRTRETPL